LLHRDDDDGDDVQLVEMLCAKCGEQTTLVNNYKLEVAREKSRCTKYTEVVEQLDSVRYVRQSNDDVAHLNAY